MKKIHQIWISDDNRSFSDQIKNTVEKLKFLYEGFDYQIYNNADCRNEVRKFNPKLTKIYDTILPYAFKADLARYIILYMYGGYYYDISICPEHRFECDLDSLLYKGIHNKLETNNLTIIENNFMFFKDSNHEFLYSTIEESIRRIKLKKYGRHPLDITGPIMLTDINCDNINFGQVKRISEDQKASYYNDIIHYKHKPKTYQANLYKMGCVGTNNYEEMWFDKKVFK